MKRLLVVLIVFLSVVTVYGQKAHLTQEQYEQKLDSFMTARMTTKMQTLFALSPQQQQAIKEATTTLNRSDKAAFMEYKKTPLLQQKMQEQEKMRDSVYQSIVGADNYAKYKAVAIQERQQKQAAMAARMQAKFGTIDTTVVKPPKNEKQ